MHHAQDRQTGLEGVRGQLADAWIDFRAVGQDQAGQLHPLAGRQCGSQHDVVAVARAHDQRAGNQAMHHFSGGTGGDHGFQHPATGQLTLDQYPCIEMAGHVQRARR